MPLTTTIDHPLPLGRMRSSSVNVQNDYDPARRPCATNPCTVRGSERKELTVKTYAAYDNNTAKPFGDDVAVGRRNEVKIGVRRSTSFHRRLLLLLLLLLIARLPFRALARSSCSTVGSCMSWSKANPPTDNVLAAHNGAGWPRSPALRAANTARPALIRYTTPRPGAAGKHKCVRCTATKTDTHATTCTCMVTHRPGARRGAEWASWSMGILDTRRRP
jgi:hypothetical protein